MFIAKHYPTISFICFGIFIVIFMIAYYQINGTLVGSGGEWFIAGEDLKYYPLLKYSLIVSFGAIFVSFLLGVGAQVHKKTKSMVEVIRDTKAGGHDLTDIEPVEDQDDISHGHVLRCRKCGQSALVDVIGVQYNWLDVVCPGEESTG